MPTASDKQRKLMEKWFGDPVSDTGPMAFLESHGFVLTPDWYWVPPVPSYTVSSDEWQCICFLIDEWDFGGLKNWSGNLALPI